MNTPSSSGKPEPGLSRAVTFAVAFLLFAAVGVAIRLQDRAEPPPSLTFGDIVRPDLRGPLPTSTDIERWKSAFTAFDLQWPEGEALQTSRPRDLLSFDNEFDGYVAGTADLVGTNLSAVIGFENDTVAWFTCHASGIRSVQTDE